ncbi:AAA family ATPase, partial [Parasutterella excrementihominis]
MISQNQNSFENLGTILLDLLTRRGKTITEELRDALAFFMLHLGQAEHLGGLCAELDATPQNKKYVELLREAELLTDSSNKIADEPNNLSVAPTPFLLDESEPKKLRIYSRRNFCSESRLAAGIHGMCSTSASDVNEVKEALAQLEQTLKNARENGDKKAYSLNPLQLEAAELAVSEKFSVICGGPGTGKTTTVVKFIEAFLEIHPKGIIQMCAPTGKATSRLLESVKNQADAGPSSAPYYPAVRKALAEDRLTSLTIHKLLVTDLSNGKRPSADNPIEADLLIVDESSMIDSALALKLIRSIDPTKTQTVFLGDKHQLAAVGPGSVFADISD